MVALLAIGSWVDAQAGLVVYVFALFKFWYRQKLAWVKGGRALALPEKKNSEANAVTETQVKFSLQLR